MKNILTNYCLAIAIFFSWATLAVAQENDSLQNKKILKQKEFKVLGSEWEYTKFDDGSTSFQTTYNDSTPTSPKVKKVQLETVLTLDLGINTWLNSESAPAVKPWGSWAVGINYSVKKKVSSHYSIKPMLGVNWYNFKFEDRNLQALRSPEGIVFEDFAPGGGTKSKITASYANLTLMNYLHSSNENFRFGFGPYAGYRLGGRGKFVYTNENNTRSKEFQRANMFANDFRYGLRGEIGIGNVDLFINYDLNEYFQANKGPQLQTLSFGIIL